MSGHRTTSPTGLMCGSGEGPSTRPPRPGPQAGYWETRHHRVVALPPADAAGAAPARPKRPRPRSPPPIGPTRGAGGPLAHPPRLALWARRQEARVHRTTCATSTGSAGAAPAWPKRPRPGCSPPTGGLPSPRALAPGAAHCPPLGPRRHLHRPAPKRPRQPAELDAPAAAARAQALAGAKRPRVEDPSTTSPRGLGPPLACSTSSGGPSPATRKRARPAGTPGLPQPTHPSPRTAPKCTSTATASARHSRPYDCG